MDFIGDSMQITELKSEKKNELMPNVNAEKIPSSASLKPSEMPAIHQPSIQLSKDLAVSLMGLIKDVNKQGVTPETVNASCNAAAQIYKILRLNYDMKRDGF